MLQHDLLDRLYKSEIGGEASALTLEMLKNVIEEKYLNGVHLELGGGAIAHNIATAIKYATELRDPKRLAPLPFKTHQLKF